MSQLSVTMSADEADLFAKLTSMIAKVAESEAAFKKAGETSSAAAAASKAAAEQAEAVARATAQAAKEQDAFAAGGKRLADQLLRSNETLEESYERQKTQIKAAHEAGKIGAKEHESALSVLQARHEQAKEAEEKAARESTEAHKRNQREIESGINLVDRLRVANTSLEDKYKQMAVEVTKAHQAGKITAEQHDRAIGQLKQEYDELKNNQQSVGNNAEGMITSMVSRWGTVAAAIGVATQALQFHNEQVEEGKRLNKELDEPFKALVTVSDSDLELTERVMQAESLMLKEGIGARKAGNIVFALESAGIVSENNKTIENDTAVDFFGKLNRITDPEAMINVAGQMQKSFGMGVQESVNLSLKASEPSSLDNAEFANQLALAAAGAAQFKGADQREVGIQTAAIVSGLTGIHTNRAGDIAKSAMLKLANEFPNATPMEAARMANAMDPELRKKTFGEDQQLTIFLSELASRAGDYESLVNTAREAVDLSGTENDTVSKRVGFADRNLTLQLNRDSNIAKARRELAVLDKAQISMEGENRSTINMANATEQEVGLFSPVSPMSKIYVPTIFNQFANYVTETTAGIFGFSPTVSESQKREEGLRSQVDSNRTAERELLKQIATNTQSQPLPPVTRPGDDR